METPVETNKMHCQMLLSKKLTSKYIFTQGGGGGGWGGRANQRKG
jgi:hypothetical protein